MNMRLRGTMGIAATLMSGMIFCQRAIAAGETFVITQESETVQEFGSWTLTHPNGQKTVSQGTPESRTVALSGTGTYRLAVVPPDGASVEIRIISGSDTETITSEFADFDVDTLENVTIRISYSYTGTVRVIGQRGARFELAGSAGLRLTGEIPETFENLPPLNYTVFFANERGCTTPRPQSRYLSEGASLTFIGDYACSANLDDEDEPAQPEPEEEDEESPAPTPDADVRVQPLVWVTADRRETLPNGMATLRIGVRNTTNIALEGLNLVQTIDPAVATVLSATQNGTVNGSIVRWFIGSIPAGQSWSAEIPVRFMDGLAAGTQMTVSANLNGTQVRDTSAQTMIGIAALPSTGVAYDRFFLALATALALIGTMVTARRYR